jgi:hypothetical protein
LFFLNRACVHLDGPVKPGHDKGCYSAAVGMGTKSGVSVDV